MAAQLTPEERAYLKGLDDKFNDRVSAPGRESIQKGSNEKPLTLQEIRAAQTHSDKFNDRVHSPNTMTPDRQKIVQLLKERATAELPQQTRPPQQQGHQQHAPGPGLGSGPKITLKGAAEVDKSSFDDQQKKTDFAAKSGQDHGKSEPSETEVADAKAASEKFYGLDHDSRLDPMPLHSYDQDRSM